jgi:nitroreductase
MELEVALKSRRSIRRYKPKDVPQNLVDELLDLARFAPSSMNGQPCSFIVIRDPAIRSRLADLKDECCPMEKRHFPATMIRTAPVVIAVCVDRQCGHDRIIENGVLAASHLLLAAHGRGLGSVFMTAYRDDEPRLLIEVRKLLAIPDDVDPIALLPLGYPDEMPPPKIMKPLSSLIHHDRFERV